MNQERSIAVKYVLDRKTLPKRWLDIEAQGEVLMRRCGFFLIAVGLLLFCFAGRPLSPEISSGVTSGVISGICFIAWLPVAKWQLLRNARKPAGWEQPVSWTITPQRLACENGEGGALLQGDFSWALVTRIKRGRHGFVVQVRGWRLQWLPYEGFEDAGMLEEFRQMARDAGIKGMH